MSKVKHAPGPWSYHPASADACIDAIERHGQDMNAVYAFNNDGEAGTVCFLSDTKIAEANARLIAAAPDLLFIAQRWAAIDGGSWHVERHAREKAELLADTATAIAKATGA